MNREEWTDIINKVLYAEELMCSQISDGGLDFSDFSYDERVQWIADILLGEYYE